MPVTPLGVFYPAGTDGYDLTVDLAAMATSIDGAVGDVTAVREIQTYKWTNAAARAAEVGMTEGDVGDQADTDQRWRYSGSAWVNVTTGLVPIIPTSVAGAGATLGPSGKVTFSAATSVSVNGCFTAAFDNYRIVLLSTNPTAQDSLMRLRAAGADAAAASSYGNQRNYGTASSMTTGNDSTDKWYLTAGANGKIATSLDLYLPAVATTTLGTGVSTATNSVTSMYATTLALYHNASTAYDGFTLYVGSGSVTGTIVVYGYNTA